MGTKNKDDFQERQPILQDSGIYVKVGGSGGQPNQSGQQYLIIQPVEFDYRHRNMYGYLSVAAFVLVLINYLMIKERACQLPVILTTPLFPLHNYNLIQSFHMTTIIVALIVFVLSYFNFAMVISDFKVLFYATAALIFVCSAMLIYNAIAITTAPCIPYNSTGEGLGALLGFGHSDNNNIFSAGDGVGITVFFFDIAAALLLFWAGRKFYQRC